MIADFIHRSAQTRVVFRAGALAQLPDELSEIGLRRPVLLAGRRTARSPAYEQTREALRGLSCVEFTEIPEHSSVAALGKVMELARAHETDGFIAVGGGSASDTAKVAALWLAEGGQLEAHATTFTPPATLLIPDLKAPKLPIVTIPCTASAAEVTPSAGIRTADGRKLLFADLKLASRLIVIDPAVNTSVPASIMLATGMNGLAHCIEGLYSKVRTPVTTALALHAIRLFVQALSQVAREPEAIASRASLLAAAHLSGLVLVNARTCLHHAICHALGAVTGASHGEANSVVLPYAMAFNAPAAPDALADAARAWGAPTNACRPEAAVELVRGLQAEIGVPQRLRDIGVPRDSLGDVARKVMGERGLYFNPRQVQGPGEIEGLLHEAW